jgi:hypothetical protein
MRWWGFVTLAIVTSSCGESVPSADGGVSDLAGIVSDLTTTAADGGTPGDDCDPLPAATSAVRDVDPSEANMLAQIVQQAAPGTTIRLKDGTYKPTVSGEGSRRLQFLKPDVTLRSLSGNKAAVILDGDYQTNEMIFIAASNVTVAHITITLAVDHLIHVTGSAAANITGTRLHDLSLVDGGEQFVKINSSGATPNTFTDNGAVTCSTFTMTAAGKPRIETLGGTSCYTGGIDGHQARGWRVARNTFQNIYCDSGPLAEHAIHFWTGSRDTIVERNVIKDCARGIGFGLVETGVARAYADDPYPGIGYIGHYDGIIRNNVIWAGTTRYDTGIELDQARGTKVYHNTVVEPATAFSSIDFRFANTVVDLRNNIVRKITDRGGMATRLNNLETSDPSLFVNAAGGADLHLAPGATAAIDKGAAVAEAGLDIDGQPHGSAPDIGADER